MNKLTFLVVLSVIVSQTVLGVPFPASILSDLASLNIPFTCNTSNFTEVFINNVSALQNIVSIRMQYPATQFIVMTLTLINVRNATTGAIITPAYNSSSPLPVFNGSMSCTYLRGKGMNSTQVLVNNFNAIQTSGANDLVFSDLSVDRYVTPYDDQANFCLWLNFYNKTNPAYSVPPCTNITQYWSDTSGLGGGATFVKNGNRAGFLRFGTSGGLSFSGGNNHTVYSCVISSAINGITTFSDNYLLIFNNSISAPWGSGIYTNGQSFANMSKNWIYNTGFSCFYSRRSFFQNVMYNYCQNFTTLPNAQTGAAGWYSWNALGWKAWGRVVKYNWFFSPSSKCWYMDAEDSNTIFDSNVCFTSISETNGGRFNNLTNNLWLFFRTTTSGTRLGDINCVGTSGATGPTSYLSCANVMSSNTGDNAFFNKTLWSNFSPNGTRLTSPDYAGSPIDIAPQLSFSTWCTPTTAGPSNTSCANENNTYVWNNVSYPMPCEALPSNNVFQFVVLYNTSTQIPYFRPGFACDCPGAACGTYNSTIWGNFSFSSSGIILSLNTFKTSFYKTASLNSTSLIGFNYNFDQPINPKNFKIAANSTLGVNEPQLLNIPFSQIGLLQYIAPTPAPTTKAPTKAPTTTPPTLAPTATPTTQAPVVLTLSPLAPETSAPTTPTAKTSSNAGSIAGITIGTILGIGCVAGGVFYIVKKKKNNMSIPTFGTNRSRVIETQTKTA